MKNIILLSLLLMSISSCCKKEPIILGCNVENPLENLDWLKELYNPANYSLDENNPNYTNRIIYIKIANGEEYISLTENGKGPLFNCLGKHICSYGLMDEDKCSIFLDQKKIVSYETLAPE